MKTKITGKFVIGFDGGDHVIYRDGEVVYEDGAILFVGHAYVGPVDHVIAAGEAIVSPGFIDLDALADIDHALLDTWIPSDRAGGLQWSEGYFQTGRHEVFSREEEAFKRRYALVQLIMNGITTALPIAAETYKEWAETYEEFADVVQIAADLGLRMYLGPSYRSGVNVTRSDGRPDVMWDESLGQKGLEHAAQFVKDFDGANNGLIRGFLAPARIETMTLDLLRASKRWSDELDCPIRLHAAQGLQEVTFLRAWYDRTPIELLHEIDFLGPRTIICHARYLSGHGQMPDTGVDEVGLLATSGSSVAYCPFTSARNAMALDSFDQYRRAGVTIGLGTDTFPPDMIRVMDYGNNIGKIVERDKASSTAADLFRAATLGSARAIGRDDLGRLAPGARADIIVVDLSTLRTGPVDDPIRTMLMNTAGVNVKTVIIEGRVVMEDGKIPGIDVEAMRDRAQRYFDTYKQAYQERDYLHRSSDVLFPPSFPVVMPEARR